LAVLIAEDVAKSQKAMLLVLEKLEQFSDIGADEIYILRALDRHPGECIQNKKELISTE